MTTDRYTALADDSASLLSTMVDWRRQIHRNPELGLQNPVTSDLIVDALSALDVEVSRGRSTTSVTATIRGGRPGPSFLLRADTDALPMDEDNDDEWRSTIPGRAHTCGHDAHVAMLLGAARLLSERRGDIAGTVRLVFQPGEEGYGGAKNLIDEGALTEGLDQPVGAAFAIHVTPNAPAGWIATRPGPLLAATDDFTVRIVGAGAHASTPHFGNDPIPVLCETVTALSTFVGRRIDAFDPAVLTVGRINGGTTTNVIAPSAEFAGTIRTVSAATRDKVTAGFRRVVEGVAAAHGCTADIDLAPGYPVTLNDAGFVKWLLPVVAEQGEPVVVEMPSPIMGAEDFSMFLEKVPGAMVFLGMCPSGIDNPFAAPSCHSNLMRIEESPMALGAALHARVAMRWLDDNA